METILPWPVGSLLTMTATRVKQMVRPSGSQLASFDISDASSPANYQRLADLLDEHGRLAYQARVLADAPWQIFWGRDRQAFLPFLERGFTLVACCDPVGAEPELLVRQFFDFARRQGKYAVFVCVTDRVRRVALEWGCGGMWLGVEQFFDLAEYSLDGKPGRTLRQDISHVRRLGGRAREICPLENAADRQALCEVERLWKAARAERNQDPLFGTTPLENAHQRRYFAVETPSPGGPQMQSFQVCSPISRRGWSLHDLVRRPDAPRGAAELAALSAMQTFRAEGVQFVSLGVAPFYDPGGQHSRAQVGPLLRWGKAYFDRLYHFSGLQRFRSKFAPTCAENVYLLYWPPILTPMVVWDVCLVMTAP